MIVNPPFYRYKPFGSREALAHRLSVPVSVLLELAASANDSYFLAKRVPKSDGTFRDVYGAHEPLKSIQKRVLDRIIKHCHFPEYLMGGIRDPAQPRDYVRNAGLHARAAILFQEDVEQFYPSISRAKVMRIFQRFMRQPPDVARCLTDLCTLNDELVQGASPSSYLANLVLWEHEPTLELELRMRGLKYTRLIDDINVSSATRISHETQQFVETAIHRMIRLAGFKAKRQKHRICSPGISMQIHNLNVDREAPRLARAERYRIRAAAHQAMLKAEREPQSADSKRDLVSVSSRIGIWYRLNPRQVERLRTNTRSALRALPQQQRTTSLK